MMHVASGRVRRKTVGLGFLVGDVLCVGVSARKPSELCLGDDDRIVKFELTFRNPVTVWVYRVSVA